MAYTGPLQGHFKFHYRITKVSYFVRTPLPPPVASITVFKAIFMGVFMLQTLIFNKDVSVNFQAFPNP